MNDTNTPTSGLPVEERAGAARQLSGWWSKAFSALAILTTLYHIVALAVISIDPWLFLGFSLGLFWMLAFLLFPATAAGRERVQPLDIVLCAAALAAMVYLGVEYEGMYLRTGYEPNTADWIFGLTAVALTIEMSRRVLGSSFPILALVFIAYALWGGELPGFLGHRGYEFDRTMATLVSTEGIFGFAMGAASTYIVLFVTFGAFLRATNVGHFFIQLATALAGGRRGGPAKVAIFASAMFGTISGSSMSNVAAVGTFTIPLMKRVGYSPAFAASVEAAASTGGQIMPPVMGSVAFVLAEATETPYREVMLAALIPAICYFTAMWFVIDFEAIKLGLKATPREDMPRLGKVLREGWLLLAPIVTLVVMIVMAGRSVMQSAIVSILAALAVDFIRRRRFIHELANDQERVTGRRDRVARGRRSLRLRGHPGRCVHSHRTRQPLRRPGARLWSAAPGIDTCHRHAGDYPARLSAADRSGLHPDGGSWRPGHGQTRRADARGAHVHHVLRLRVHAYTPGRPRRIHSRRHRRIGS